MDGDDTARPDALDVGDVVRRPDPGSVDRDDEGVDGCRDVRVLVTGDEDGPVDQIGPVLRADELVSTVAQRMHDALTTSERYVLREPADVLPARRFASGVPPGRVAAAAVTGLVSHGALGSVGVAHGSGGGLPGPAAVVEGGGVFAAGGSDVGL